MRGRRAMVFQDRADAGRQLAARLSSLSGPETVVLGIPRGGVVVAAEVARVLGAQLDVVVARKLRAPGAPELAIGAVTADGICWTNERILRDLEVSERYLETERAAQARQAAEREQRLRRGGEHLPLAGRAAIVVDDGLATGATMRAAVASVRERRPSRLVVAVPVGSPEACAALREQADELICLHEPFDFAAVGEFYVDFASTQDEEVDELLAAQRRSAAGAPASRQA